MNDNLSVCKVHTLNAYCFREKKIFVMDVIYKTICYTLYLLNITHMSGSKNFSHILYNLFITTVATETFLERLLKMFHIK